MDSKISKLLKILKLILEWRMITSEDKEQDIIDQIIEISNAFFEKSFLDKFENESNFMDMFEAMVLKEIETIDNFISIFLYQNA